MEIINGAMPQWLTHESKGWRLVGLSALTLLINFFTSFSIILVLLALHIHLPDQLKNLDHANFFVILVTVLPGTFFEELLFRLPMALAVHRWGRSYKVLVSAVVLSVVFGFVHGTVFNILIQGLVGFAYCILFLKAGGYVGKNKKAILTTWIVHSLYDLILILPLSG